MELWNGQNQETDFTKINKSCIKPALELQVILVCGINQGKITGELKDVSLNLVIGLSEMIQILQIRAEQLKTNHIETTTQKRFEATGMHPLDKSSETKYADIYSNVLAESQIVTRNHINRKKLYGLCDSSSVDELISLAESKAEELNSEITSCSVYDLIPLTLKPHDFLEHVETMAQLQLKLESFIKSAKLSKQTPKELDS